MQVDYLCVYLRSSYVHPATACRKGRPGSFPDPGCHFVGLVFSSRCLPSTIKTTLFWRIPTISIKGFLIRAYKLGVLKVRGQNYPYPQRQLIAVCMMLQPHSHSSSISAIPAMRACKVISLVSRSIWTLCIPIHGTTPQSLSQNTRPSTTLPESATSVGSWQQASPRLGGLRCILESPSMDSRSKLHDHL